MDGTKVITVSRQALYDRIWTTPITAVCRDYGISNVGLAKVCRRHKIPCPPRGYWAKKQTGKTVRRTPLPSCADPDLQTIETGHEAPPLAKEDAEAEAAEASRQEEVRLPSRPRPAARP
jgi:hypothetical protein